MDRWISTPWEKPVRAVFRDHRMSRPACPASTWANLCLPAAQAKGTYLRDKFHRLKARMGAKKAAMAMAHKILVAAFHMLQRGVGFTDLGADYLDRVNKHRTAKRLARRLDALGYDVMLRPKATA